MKKFLDYKLPPSNTFTLDEDFSDRCRRLDELPEFQEKTNLFFYCWTIWMSQYFDNEKSHEKNVSHAVKEYIKTLKKFIKAVKGT